MARDDVTHTLTAACSQLAALKAGLAPATSISGAQRVALTHALHCGICGPLADQHRREQAETVARLTAEADEETARQAVPVLDQTEKTLEANGYHRHYLWDTAQAATGTPLELCRVSIVGAVAVTLYGNPRYTTGAHVHAVERLIAAQAGAPSVAAWESRRGVGLVQAVGLVRATADGLRGGLS